MNRRPPPDGPWLAVLPPASVPSLGPARLCAGIEAAAAGDAIWLRGSALTESIAAALRGISGLDWREPIPGNRWRRPDERLPAGTLPAELRESDWRPLRSALVPDMPELAIAGPHSPFLSLRVVPGGEEHKANLLVTTIARLCAWAESAAEVRLHALRFAVSTGGGAIVHGRPLPPLSAEAWWESGGIAIPCGYQTEPALTPSLIREVLHLPDSWKGITLLHPTGMAEHLPEESFAALNRASARMSAALHQR